MTDSISLWQYFKGLHGQTQRLMAVPCYRKSGMERAQLVSFMLQGTTCNFITKIRDFVVAENVVIVEMQQNGRRIARRVVGTIWVGDEHAQERWKAVALLEGVRRAEIYLNITSSTRALHSSFIRIE